MRRAATNSRRSRLWSATHLPLWISGFLCGEPAILCRAIPHRSPARFIFRWVLGAVLLTPISALAAEVVFLNGDRLTGKIVSVLDGELVLETDGAGEVTINLKKVRSISSDEPVKVRVGEKPPFESTLAAGPDGQVKIQENVGAAATLVPIEDITAINPPVPAWYREIALNTMLTRGNAERIEAGVRTELQKDWDNDHLLFGGEYFYGRERDDDSEEKSTTDDFGEGHIKYEHDITGKLYFEGRTKVLHNTLAELQYRLTPTSGVGYRLLRESGFSLFTELGIAYTRENYDTFGARDFWGPTLAYGLEWAPAESLNIFTALEYYPSFSDFTGNYLIDVNGGLHADITRRLFMEFRVEYFYNNEPAAGARKGDFRLILGPGWGF